MANGVRWGIVVAAGVFVIGLAAYARGSEHHRGDDVGSHGTKVVVVRTDDR